MTCTPAANDPTDGDSGPSNARVEPRSNIFIVATLYSPIGSSPVLIRNMSRCGALVEGGVLPARDEEIQLSRGSLSVSGLVAWCEGGKAGLRFGSSVAVADWLPRGSRSASQLRIDEIVFAAKGIVATSVDLPRAAPAVRSSPPVHATGDLADTLLQLRKCLESIAEELGGDIDVAARFQTELQLLDLSAQKLGDLVDGLG